MKRFKQNPPHYALLPCVALSFAILAAAQQSPPDLRNIVAEAAARAKEYTRKFREITAEEIKITEIFDRSGKIEQRRKVISDFVVYESRLDRGNMVEYHNVREVDGKPITNREQRVITLFERLARASSIEKELERIERESYRYDLKLRMEGLTLNQGLALKEKHRSSYSFEIAGREPVDGNDVIAIRFQQIADAPEVNHKISLPSEFNYPQPQYRGTLWLDARTFQIWREECELTVRHPGAQSPLTLIRYDQSYGLSDFGILTPRKFVLSFFNHFQNKGRPELLLSGRLTYTYSQFKRFQVTGEEKPDPAVSGKPPKDVL